MTELEFKTWTERLKNVNSIFELIRYESIRNSLEIRKSIQSFEFVSPNLFRSVSAIEIKISDLNYVIIMQLS